MARQVALEETAAQLKKVEESLLLAQKDKEAARAALAQAQRELRAAKVALEWAREEMMDCRQQLEANELLTVEQRNATTQPSSQPAGDSRVMPFTILADSEKNVPCLPASSCPAVKRQGEPLPTLRGEVTSTLGDGPAAEAAFKATGRNQRGIYKSDASTELNGGQPRWPAPESKRLKK